MKIGKLALTTLLAASTLPINHAQAKDAKPSHKNKRNKSKNKAISTPPPGCEDTPPNWADADGDGCDWYAVGDRCADYGDWLGHGQTMTAKEVCCVCSTSTTPPTSSVIYGLQPNCHIDDPSKYDICLDLASISGSVEPWMNAVISARDHWESVIVGDTGVTISTEGAEANYTATGYPSLIDDVYIAAKAADIDGPSGILGMAANIYGRKLDDKTNPHTGQPYGVALSGFIEFDIADINTMIDDGEWEAVIKHEMAHALGFGLKQLWGYNGLYEAGSGVFGSGTHAEEEWHAIGCSGELPVELDGGPGTAEGHWEEDCLNHELMTGFCSGSQQPLSRITIASFEDMGYTVDYNQADPFDKSDLMNCGNFCPGARRLRSSNKKKPKRITKEGRAKVLSYAKKEFQVLSAGELSRDVLPEGFFAGTTVIDVLFKDENGIHSITVTPNDIGE